eukprot:TRINITY_DN85771_c0_g1_i1.p2 TRINITY_DN85771_c0_g1~~TRINITY_DN85771_c0_g1_i1.p2  ORF type:complete len:279 (-),score=56.80 TRINITY_DN85771_c0_g1_i1:80-916(-)
MAASAAAADGAGAKYSPLEIGPDDTERGLGPRPEDAPRQWQKLLAPGAGQCEYQDYDTWTPEEKQKFKEGTLKCKWAIGQVSIRLPLDGPLSFVAILYGYLPFLIPIAWFVWSLTSYFMNGKARFFPTYGLAIAASFALVNETITKKLFKKFAPESITSRPAEAVCKHPGMPSGHVMNAYTLMIWCLLEALFDSTALHPEWLVLILLIMGPVPWARVYNKDHTVLQVTVSAVCSLVMGSIAFYVRRTYFPHHFQPWDGLAMRSMEMMPLPSPIAPPKL